MIGRFNLLCCHFLSPPLSLTLIGFEREKDLSPHITTFSTLKTLSFQPCVCIYILQVIRSHDLGNWTLQIKYPHLRDNGVYECQINTEPKMSLSYVLNVVGKAYRLETML